MVAIVDDEDFDRLSVYSWYAHAGEAGNYYAARRDGNRKMVWMQKEIMRAGDHEEVDHIDLDGLNNTRRNLRKCTRRQNNMNRRLPKNSTSGLKGAYFHSTKKRWYSTITINNKTIHLGYYQTPEEAHKAYMESARFHFGDFSRER